ncbi:TPA: phage baseplate assembly protein V [Neisseria subflava]
MTAELNRKIANIIKQGVIAESDPARALVRVQHGELTSDWLPYFVPFAGGVSVHRPPSVGENCIILSPSGETANGLVLCGMASALFPSPAQSADETVVKFPDGAIINYNHNSGQMTLKAVAKLTIDAPDTLITGNVVIKKMTTSQGLLTYTAGMSGSGGGGGGTTIKGDINHEGTLTNNGKITSNGVVLDTHIHIGGRSGDTGKPK